MQIQNKQKVPQWYAMKTDSGNVKVGKKTLLSIFLDLKNYILILKFSYSIGWSFCFFWEINAKNEQNYLPTEQDSFKLEISKMSKKKVITEVLDKCDYIQDTFICLGVIIGSAESLG